MASAQINDVVGWLAHARHTVALTGAGISTESGIPDFRGPQGCGRATRRRSAVHIRLLRGRSGGPPAGVAGPADHPACERRRRTPGTGRWSSWSGWAAFGFDHPEHRRAAPAPPAAPGPLIEIHGTLREDVCLSCGRPHPMTEAAGPRARRRGRPGLPGLRRHPEVGDHLVRPVPGRRGSASAPFDERRGLHLLLAIGTSLTVYPVAWLPDGRCRPARAWSSSTPSPRHIDDRAARGAARADRRDPAGPGRAGCGAAGMSDEVIAAERLDLPLLSLEQLDAIADGDAGPVASAAGRGDFTRMGGRGPLAGGLPRQADAPASAGRPWLLRPILPHRTGHPREAIGYLNFHAAPDEHGMARSATRCSPAARGQGYAMEAVEAAFAWATRVHGIRRFRASRRRTTTLAEPDRQAGLRHDGRAVGRGGRPGAGLRARGLRTRGLLQPVVGDSDAGPPPTRTARTHRR